MSELFELMWCILPPGQAPRAGSYQTRSETDARAYLAGLLTGARLDLDSVDRTTEVGASITRGASCPVLIQRWDGRLPAVLDTVTGR